MIIPLIIANSLHVSLMVINEDTNGYIRSDAILPSSTPSGEIIVLRRSDHYNGILHIARPEPKRSSYSRESLLSLRECATKITRSVRKCLFRLNIWKPQSSTSELRVSSPPVDMELPIQTDVACYLSRT